MHQLQPRRPDLRGTCQQAIERLVADEPHLTAARGWYLDAQWGPQEHWWAVDADGEITDPTVEQFPTGHIPTLRRYQAYDGTHPCPGCGVHVETEQSSDGFCCGPCHGATVGIPVGFCQC